MMNLDFDLGARRAKAILLDGDDRVVAVASAGARGQMGGATPVAVCKRDWWFEAFQPEAARAANFVASDAHRRRLGPFAKEISQ
jgi:hypothetical protein